MALPPEVDREWMISEPIGQGGQSETFLLKAKDSGDRSERVLKVRKDATPESCARFSNEVRVLLEVRHENIVPVLDYDRSNQPVWYVMPRGGDFRRWWKTKFETLSGEPERLFRASIEVIQGVLHGLCELHKRDYTHRDIKPGNVVIIEDRPVLIDLGLVHHAELEGNTGPSGAGNKFVILSRSIPPSPQLDNLCVASLWIYMLLSDRNQSYGHYDWRFVDLVSSDWPYSVALATLAVCSGMTGAPESACALSDRLRRHFKLPDALQPVLGTDNVTELLRRHSASAAQDTLDAEKRRLAGQALLAHATDPARVIADRLEQRVKQLAANGIDIGCNNETEPCLKRASEELGNPGDFSCVLVHVYGSNGTKRRFGLDLRMHRDARTPDHVYFVARAQADVPEAGEQKESVLFVLLSDLSYRQLQDHTLHQGHRVDDIEYVVKTYCDLLLKVAMAVGR